MVFASGSIPGAIVRTAGSTATWAGLAPGALLATALFACQCGEGAARDTGSSSQDAAAGEASDGGAAPHDAGTSGVPFEDAAADVASTPAPGSCAPSWTTTPACGGGSNPPGPAPDFGPHVLIFDPSTSMATIQSQLDTVDGMMDQDQFDNNGYAYFFKPGQYALDVRVGYYMHVLGLGESPDDVVITGAVRSKAALPNGNATCNFWRTVENFAVIPTAAIDNGADVWAVSQGCAMRRAHIQGSIVLDDSQFDGQGNWSSGGFIADSKIDTQINSGTQQQFLTRNDDLTSWVGSDWNMVFVGDGQPPSGTWPNPPYTVVPATPVVREKPFLYIDGSGNYLVMVPALKTSSSGSSWGSEPGDAGSPVPPGSPLSIDRFYVAKPGMDTAATMNAALSQGKHLLLTPGDYALDAPIQVTLPNTIVLGIGIPVLTPMGGNSLLTIADVRRSLHRRVAHRGGAHDHADAAGGGPHGKLRRSLEEPDGALRRQLQDRGQHLGNGIQLPYDQQQ